MTEVKEFYQNENFVPATHCTLNKRVNIGDRLKIYGTNVAVHHVKKVIKGNSSDPEFIYYMISCDPNGRAWYHISKKTDANIQKLE